MVIYRYTVVLEKDPEEKAYTVTVPALPGCVTEGDTVEASLAMARDAISGHLESLIELGQPPSADVENVHLEVSDSEEILVYKVEIRLEQTFVKASKG